MVMSLPSDTDKKEKIKKELEELDAQFETFKMQSLSTASDAKSDIDKMAERAKKTIQRLE